MKIGSLSPSPPLGGEGWGEGGLELTPRTCASNAKLIHQPLLLIRQAIE